MQASDGLDDLLEHLERTTGLTRVEVRRVVEEVLTYFSESTEQVVARRHAELQGDTLRSASRAMSASPIHGGQPTASRTTPTPIRTPTAAVRSRSCTTGSSRTPPSCGHNSKPRATRSARTPTRKCSPT